MALLFCYGVAGTCNIYCAIVNRRTPSCFWQFRHLLCQDGLNSESNKKHASISLVHQPKSTLTPRLVHLRHNLSLMLSKQRPTTPVSSARQISIGPSTPSIQSIVWSFTRKRFAQDHFPCSPFLQNKSNNDDVISVLGSYFAIIVHIYY
jgi:hypothetical protein